MATNRAIKSVRVTNESSHDYTDMYDSNRFTIKAGSDAIIPFDAACLWLGDPQLMDRGTSPADRHRTAELHRIQIRCGWHEGKVYDNPAGASDEAQAGRVVDWDEHRPKLAVYDPDTGNRVPMVAEAPDGASVNLFAEDGDVVDDKARIKQLEQAVAALVASGKPHVVDQVIDEVAARGGLNYGDFPGVKTDGPDADRDDAADKAGDHEEGWETASNEPPVDAPSRVKATPTTKSSSDK